MSNPNTDKDTKAVTAKRGASREHSEAPQGRRRTLMDPDEPVDTTEEMSGALAHDLGPGANPFASSSTDLRLSSSAMHESGHQARGYWSVRSDSTKENHVVGGSDAASTSDRWDQEDQEEQAAAAHEMNRRLNLQRGQGYVTTISMVLDVCHRNGDDARVEEIRVALERFVDELIR
ncbi:hypothetical protein LTR08_004169 [Meristemomyces frigidus]|nr:hypothetical protein LTR08_004169 [Meristemomyces frigidus]